MANTKTHKSKVVPVFFGCDNRFTPYLMTSLASLIDNASKRRTYEVHILHTDIKEDVEKQILAMSTKNIHIELNNVSKSINDIVSHLPIRDYYSASTYFRFLIACNFPQYNKAVYIDADTVVMGDVAKLFDTQIGNNYVAAVPEAVLACSKACATYVQKVLGISSARYFNAGVLVINSYQWRKHDIMGQFLFLINYYNFVVAQDQDYLNVICKNRVRYLPRKWNMETLHPYHIQESNFGIVHYAFAAKPWQDINCIYGHLFWKYASTLPVYGTIKQAFASVTDEQLRAIQGVGAAVDEACLKEIERNDNFLKRVEGKKTVEPLLGQPQMAELVTRLRAHA